MARPLLDNIELQQVQEIETEQDQVLVQHAVPALEGDFLQRLDRRATQVTLTGVLTGPEVGDGLKALREKFQSAQSVPFVSDITTATKVDEVLIEEMGVRELAGKPERFEYAFTLCEFITPPVEETEEPPPVPDEPPDPEVATLEVEVVVESDPNFDFSTTRVTVEGPQEDGSNLSRTLTNRENNVWTETDFPPGQYTARAVVFEPSMAGTAEAVVRSGQTTRVTITLRRDRLTNIAKAFIVHFRFDSAFVEPCMRNVLRQVVEYASAHPDEKLVIVGHTDMVGDRPPVPPLYNQSLSERRARSVYAYLTFGRDHPGASTEWNQFRRRRPASVRLSINDSWGTREYQYILQDLGYYSGSVDGIHGQLTDSAVRAFQEDNGLAVDGIVGDLTWPALVDTYLGQDALAISESQFLPNAKDGCNGGILKWLGCGEQDPVKNTEDAWRPNRRTELLFVRADALPCEVSQPDTFDLPTSGAVNNTWCLGQGNPDQRSCFLTRQTEQLGKWLVQPAEPGVVVVHGRITYDDGTPLANARYVLIAPDGEYMDGERPRGPDRGKPISGRTDANGEFSYPDKPKGIGIYTLELEKPLIVRLEEEPLSVVKGNVVCKRLDGSSDFDVVVFEDFSTVSRTEVLAVTVGDELEV